MLLSSAILLGALALSGGDSDGSNNDSQATWSIEWSSVDAGAAYLSGGAFELHGTIGQADAGFHASATFDLVGGFHGVEALAGPGLVGDINGDGIVGNIDLAILLGAWGSPGGPADLNGDGIVDNIDLAILLGAWSA